MFSILIAEQYRRIAYLTILIFASLC